MGLRTQTRIPLVISQNACLKQVNIFHERYCDNSFGIAEEIDLMSSSQTNFDKAIWNIVSGIAAGHVMSYGEVARAAGFPRHARLVSKAMRRSDTMLPWHRVIRSDRTLAFEVGSESYNKQKKLLEEEGVQIINKKVTRPESDEIADLDKLLWAPNDI